MDAFIDAIRSLYATLRGVPDNMTSAHICSNVVRMICNQKRPPRCSATEWVTESMYRLRGILDLLGGLITPYKSHLDHYLITVVESTTMLQRDSRRPCPRADYALVLRTDDEVYEIDKVHHAERVGNHFKIYLLWKTGEITWRWYLTLRKETKNEELLKDMREAVSAEIARRRITNPSGDTSREVDSRDEMPPPTDKEVESASSPTVELGRGKRIRNPAQCSP